MRAATEIFQNNRYLNSLKSSFLTHPFILVAKYNHQSQVAFTNQKCALGFALHKNKVGKFRD